MHHVTLPKKIMFCFVISIIGLLIVFVWGEIFVRLNNRLYSDGLKPSKNEKLVYELDPDATVTVFKGKINSKGLYDEEYTVKKPPGVYRIAVVGDSLLFGGKMDWTKNATGVLESCLNRDNDSRHYEVINFAVTGYNTAQMLEMLKARVLAYDPDMVILTFLGNDMYLCLRIQPDINIKNFLFHRSFLIHWILWQVEQRVGVDTQWWISFKKHILGMYYYWRPLSPYPGLEKKAGYGRSMAMDPSVIPEKYWYMVGKKNYKKNLEEFIRILKKRNIKFLACGDYTKEYYVYEAYQELGVENVFLLNEASRLAAKHNNRTFEEEVRMSQVPNNGHYTEYGHKVVGEYLCAIVRREIFRDR